jgi:peptide/nickel transport system permease protein
MNYALRRVVHAGLLLLGASVLCFAFSALAPGDYFDEVKLNPQISKETVAALRSQYGLDKPLALRYENWANAVLRGNWGYSLSYNTPVSSLLKERAFNTLILNFSALLLAWIIAIPLGILGAMRPASWINRIQMLGTSLLLALPELVLALGLLYFAMRSHSLPVGGKVSANHEHLASAARFSDTVVHLIGPAIILAIASLPILVRHIRSSMVEALDKPFVKSARGHGISPWRILLRYALPAAANPWISLFGLSLGGLLSGSLLVEIIMGWPGLGPLLLDATMSRDLYVVVGVVMASTIFMIFGSLLADLMLLAIDPRVRAE